MKKKWLIATMGLTLWGCAPVSAPNTTTPSTEKVLSIGDTQLTAGIDPAVDFEGWFTVRFGIAETLFVLDKEVQLQPNLAQSYEKIDDSSWRIHLQPEVTFSNGKSMDSQAVVDSLKRLGDKHAAATIFKEASYEVEDKTSFVIHTKEAFPTLIHELSDTKTAIVDASTSDAVIGTGPFKVAAFQSGESIDLDRNETYWKGTPNLEKVHYQYIPDAKTLALSVVSGQLDGAVDLSDDVMETFKGQANIQTYQQSSTRVYHLQLRQETIPDVRIRKAILAAIDKQSITQELLQGRVIPTDGAFPKESLFGNGEFTNAHYQPEMSTELLAQAGYTEKNADGILVDAQGNPLKLTLKTYKRLNNEKIATALQAQLKAVGIDLQIETAEKVDGLALHDYDIALASAVTLPTGEPYYFLQTSLSKQGGLNYVGNTLPQVESNLQTLRTQEAGNAQVALVSTIQQEEYDEALVDYIGFVTLHAAMQKSVKNFDLYPSDYYQLTYEVDKQP